MDENMKLIMAEFAKINMKLDHIDERVTGLEKTVERLDTRVTSLEKVVGRLDERVASLEETTSKLETRMTAMETRMAAMETRMTAVETIIKEAELDQVNNRLGMIELKIDKLQDHYEKLDADMRVLSGETASGFYKIKHQIRKLEDQGKTIVTALEMRNLIPFRE